MPCEYNVTAGTRWSSGGVIATFKDVFKDPIWADRSRLRGTLEKTVHAVSTAATCAARSLSVHQSLGESVDIEAGCACATTVREQEL